VAENASDKHHLILEVDVRYQAASVVRNIKDETPTELLEI
jgi:hypothetical protein